MKLMLEFENVRKSRIRTGGFTIVEIVTIVGIVGLVLAIGMPVLVANREKAQNHSCVQNLREIHAAKERYAAAENLSNGAGIPGDIIGSDYLNKIPTCPSGGEYTFNRVGEDPQCSIPEHSL